MENNPHQRIGTFCDKCRNIICTCNSNKKYYNGFKKGDLIKSFDGYFICLNEISNSRDTIIFLRGLSLVKLLVFNFEIITNIEEERLLFNKENPIIKEFSDNESSQDIRYINYTFETWLRGKYYISNNAQITPCS